MRSKTKNLSSYGMWTSSHTFSPSYNIYHRKFSSFSVPKKKNIGELLALLFHMLTKYNYNSFINSRQAYIVMSEDRSEDKETIWNSMLEGEHDPPAPTPPTCTGEHRGKEKKRRRRKNKGTGAEARGGPHHLQLGVAALAVECQW